MSILTVTAPAALATGAGVLSGDIFGVATNAAASGAPVEITVDGVWPLPKDSSTFTNGAPVYWDNTALLATSSISNGSGPNTLIGVADLVTPIATGFNSIAATAGTAALGAASGDATVQVRLNANFGLQLRASGTLVNGNLVKADAHGNLLDSGVAAAALAPLTLGSAAGLGLLQVAHAIYSFAVDGGAVSTLTPASSATIPANAIIVGGLVNPTTAPTGTAGATLAVGTSAGSSANSLLTATTIADLTIDLLVAMVPTLAAPIKMSAAGAITVTIATHAFTGGIIEIFVFYIQAAHA